MTDIPHLDVEASIEDGTGRLRLAGELDLAGCDALTQAFESFVREGVGSVAIDASAVTFLDSSGLRALLAGHRAITDAGLGFAIEQVSPAVERLLHVTGTRAVLLPD
jgi:anti-anti-sigma factor